MRRSSRVGWHEHGEGLFEGTARFFRAGYEANLVSSWLPALTGVEDKLRVGARVADVGCGCGASNDHHGEGVPELDIRGPGRPRAAARTG